MMEEYSTNSIIVDDSYGNKVMFLNYSSVTEDIKWMFLSNLSIQSSNEKAVINPSFPYLEEFPDNVKDYLAFTKTANEDSRIKLKANEVVAGANNYFDAVARIAEFVAYYIEYDLNYFYSSSANASQVFSVKGCLRRVRNLGNKPLQKRWDSARYVSGHIHTNIGKRGCKI